MQDIVPAAMGAVCAERCSFLTWLATNKAPYGMPISAFSVLSFACFEVHVESWLQTGPCESSSVFASFH